MNPKASNTKKVQKEPAKLLPVITIEDARIAFRNFSGKEGQYNAAGRRNFCVLIDESVAKDLISQGWNVRYLKAKESDDPDQAYMQVSVSYKNFPPMVAVISGNKKTILDESSIHVLDWAEIEKVDLIIRPYSWEVNGKTGVKAYLKKMYVTLVEDELEAKYSDIPNAAVHSQDVDGD